jgi:hypothetical protein
MTEQAGAEFHLASFVAHLLVPGSASKEQYVLHPRFEEGMAIALGEIFESGADPKAELDALLRLIWSLSAQCDSPTAANALIGALSRHPRALAVLGISEGEAAKDRLKAFGRFAARSEKPIAPVFGRAAPAGSVKLSTLLDPGARERPRTPPRPARRGW